MWNGAAESLNASPTRIIASPPTKKRLVRLGRGGGDLDEARARRSRRRRTREPKSRIAEPKLPTIRYLSPASSDESRSTPIAIEHVERDREPLQAEEEREQRVRLEEEAHPGDGGEQERVVLDDALAVVGDRRRRVAVRRAALPVRDADREEPGDRDEDLAELGEAVADERAVHERRAATSSIPKRTPAMIAAPASAPARDRRRRTRASSRGAGRRRRRARRRTRRGGSGSGRARPSRCPA